MNYARTALLLAIMTALFAGVGYLVSGPQGMVIALAIAVAMNVISYWNSDQIVLSTYGAREVDETTAPAYYGLVRDLALRAGMPMPRVFVIDSEQPNAFATGRDPEHAAVAATTGLLHLLSREELCGVMAHELAHVRNRDTLIMTITATIAGALTMLLNVSSLFGLTHRDGENDSGGLISGLLLMILAPLGAMIVQMAVSRSREYEADRIGGELCGNPLWLASALERLHSGIAAQPNPIAEHNPATAHLFIVNPLSGRAFDNLFSTHPSMENRVQALYEQAQRSAPVPRRTGPWG